MPRFGASFSVPYAQYLGLNPKQCLGAAVEDLGVKRFRLMSYWSRLEPVRGEYDWRELDWQIDMVEAAGGEVTLCLGLRQPRWPESHWPDWAKDLPADEWQGELMKFITATIKRYKNRHCIVSYQLENEALNRSFGERGDFDRDRLNREYQLVKSLDSNRLVIMTTSNSWGVPLQNPTPDLYGFSIYRYFFDRGQYRHSRRWPLFYRIRAMIIRLVKRRPVFIHELQAEPWGPNAIPDMSLEEQFKSISPARIVEAVDFAKATRLYPIDIWGLEWWYWLKTEHARPDIWDYMKTVFK